MKIKLDNIDPLLSSIKEIKEEIVGNKESERKKETYQRRTQWGTLAIAIMSLAASIFTVIYNVSKDTFNNIYQRKTDSTNAKFQRESQAYTFWLSYLQLAEQNPDMANGPKEINGCPVRDLADRRWIKKKFKPADIKKFKKYAWFVANVLAYAERVAELTKGDSGWKITIEKAIHIHIEYIRSRAFFKCDLQDYSDLLQDEIKEATK